MSSPSPTRPSEKAHSFAVVLTVYVSKKNKSKTVKEEKSTKTKELVFRIDENNYIDFLQSILKKHGQGHFKVSEKKHFPFKFVPPKAKRSVCYFPPTFADFNLVTTYFSQCVNDAIDVDNKADYAEMVKKIHARNPGTTKIYVDMKHIEKIPLADDSDGGSNESSEDDNGRVCM